MAFVGYKTPIASGQTATVLNRYSDAWLRTMPEHGFVTGMGARMGRDGNSGSTTVSLFVAHGSTRDLIANTSKITLPSGSSLTDYDVDFTAAQAVESGTPLLIGAANNNLNTAYFRKIDVPNETVYEWEVVDWDTIPDPLPTYHTSFSSAVPRLYLTYIPNAAPTKGTWQTGTVSGDTADLDPTFVGNLPHSEAVANSVEYSTTVQVKITRLTDSLVVWNQSFTPTTTEKNNRLFTRELGLGETLLPGHSYQAEYRHMDRFGVWSVYSDPVVFTVVVGPQAPTIIRPLGKIDYTGEGQTGSPTYFYAGEYSHPSGTAMDDAQVRVYNETGTVLIYDSGWVAPASGTGSPGFEVDQWHANLTIGTNYQVWMRTRDTSLLESPWAVEDFNTNKAPTAPTNLSPSAGQSTSNTVLSCKVTDPDGDDIQSVTFDVLEDDVAPAGYPKTVTGPFASGATVTLDIDPDVTAGSTIEWRAKSTDGVTEGVYSSFASYQLADVPTVDLIFPAQNGITNLVQQPSAEFDPAGLSAYWAEDGNDATNLVQRIESVGAWSGDWVWQMTSDGTAAHEFVSGEIAVDVAEDAVIGVAVRKISGTGSHSLSVDCLDGTGAVLGTLSTDGAYGAFTDADPATGWEIVGGLIAAASWPVGTVDVKLRFRRTTATALASVVQFDGFRFYAVDPALTADYVDWFGYIDGSRESSSEEGVYSWSGTAGDSTSSGPAVLMDPGADMLISYTSGVGKIEDRVTLEQWTGPEWVRVYTGDWRTSSSNVIPLPADYYQNQGHYRVMVEAKSGTLLVGSSPWVEFQTDYEGPDQLPIQVVTEDSDNARITVTFPASQLPTLEFIEIQMAVQTADGNLVIVDRITDPSATQAVFHSPVSGVDYDVMVRQVQDTEFGPVESRWAVAAGRVDYNDWHLKGVENPVEDHVRFTVYADVEPTDEPQTEVSALRGWGEAKPTHYLNSANYQIGSIPVQIRAQDDNRQQKSDAMTRLIGKEAVLLSTLPDEKRFVTVVSAPRKLARRPFWVTYEVAWEENGWVEDAVRRAG